MNLPVYYETHPVGGNAADLAESLALVAFAFGRLSQCTKNNPLLPAIIYRARLEAARACASADGTAINLWHLAAVLAGLRLRLDGGERIADRGGIFAAARQAIEVHSWFADPDFDQEGEIRQAEMALSAKPAATPWQTAALVLREWVEAGRPRMAIRAALIRHWHRHGLLPLGLPVVGATSLAAGEDWDAAVWLPRFFHKLANEANEICDLAGRLDHAWRQARFAVRDRRRSSHAPAFIDLLAAAPMLSSLGIATALGIARKNVLRLADELVADGVLVEVSRRERGHLYALPAMAPLRNEVAAPRRPEFGRGRGRPPEIRLPQTVEHLETAPIIAPVSRMERFEFDYSGLDAAMLELEAASKRTRATLDAMFGKPEKGW